MRSGLFGIAMAVACAQGAAAQERQPKAAPSQYDGIIARHAAATGVPEALIRRVIVRESKYNPRALSRGNYGMMQIKPATARSMGYQGGPAGLLDADTNLTYAVRYLAGAYRVAGGNHDRAVRLYASGYYYDAKRRGMLAAVGLGRNAKPFVNVASSTPAAAAAPAAAAVKVETRVTASAIPQQPAATKPAPTSSVAAASPRVISANAAPALASSFPGVAKDAKPTAPASRVATAAAAVGGFELRTAAAEPSTPDPKAAAYAGPRQPASSPFTGVAAPRAATVPTPPLPPVARVVQPAAPALGVRGPVAPTTPIVAAIPTPPARDPMVATGSTSSPVPARAVRSAAPAR